MQCTCHKKSSKNHGLTGLMLKKNPQYDCVANNIITSALNFDKFFRVSQCSSTKDMLDILEVTHEGTSYVKRVRKHDLIQKYKLFKM